MNDNGDGDSSSDDDFYQNLTKNMKRKLTDGFSINDQTTTEDDDAIQIISSGSAVPPPKRNKTEVVDEEDSDDDIMVYGTPSVQEIIEKRSRMLRREEKMKEAHEEEEKNAKKSASVTLSSISDPKFQEAETRLKELAELEAASKHRSNYKLDISLDSSNNRSLTEDYYEEPDSVNFLIKDLEHASETSVCRPWKNTQEIALLRREYANTWNCHPKEIVITWDKRTLQDSDTPLSLEMSNDIQIINVFRVVTEKTKDPNIITIKCLQADKRAVLVSISKISKFSEIKKAIATKLKLECVTKLVFDSEQLSDNDTPADLDMEDEDCIEIYS